MSTLTGPIRRGFAIFTAIAAAMALTIMPGTAAYADESGTSLFEQTFLDSTLTQGASVHLPSVSGGSTNVACLTASNQLSVPNGSLPGCNSPALNANGSGALRLTTANVADQVGAVFSSVGIPSSSGIDINFNIHMYGGSSADGLAFSMAAINPHTQELPKSSGIAGGGLGYTLERSTPLTGMPHAYLGIGFDVYGNYSHWLNQSANCETKSWANGQAPQSVLVRGPGNGLNGYCALNGSRNSGNPGGIQSLRLNNASGVNATRDASAIPVRITINPRANSVVNQDGDTVAAHSYFVSYVALNSNQKRSLTGPLPDASAYTDSSWLDENGVPKQLAVGWSASTGGQNQTSEITRTAGESIEPVSSLLVSQEYRGAIGQTDGTGRGRLEISPKVGPDAPLKLAAQVTGTIPSNMKIVGNNQSGWTCVVAANERDYACQSDGSDYPAGSDLGTIGFEVELTGVVTKESIRSTTVSQIFSPNSLSGSDSDPLIEAVTATEVSPPTGSTNGGTLLTIKGEGLAGSSVKVGDSICSNVTVSSDQTTLTCQTTPHSAGLVDVTVTTTVSVATLADSFTYVASEVSAPVITKITGLDRELAVQFTPPQDGESHVDGYEYSTDNGATWQPVDDGSKGAFRITHTSGDSTPLINGTTYSVVIRAMDGQGASPSSNMELGTPIGPPPPPPPVHPTGKPTKKKQHFRKGSPPRRVLARGITTLNKRNAKTREGQPMTARLLVRQTRGEIRCFRVIKGKQRKLAIRTYGQCSIRLSLVYTAPGNSKLYAFKEKKTYRVRR